MLCRAELQTAFHACPCLVGWSTPFTVITRTKGCDLIPQLTVGRSVSQSDGQPSTWAGGSHARPCTKCHGSREGRGMVGWRAKVDPARRVFASEAGGECPYGRTLTYLGASLQIAAVMCEMPPIITICHSTMPKRKGAHSRLLDWVRSRAIHWKRSNRTIER